MARPVRATLPSILAVVLLFLFQVADSSATARPLSTEEQRRPRADPTPAVHHRALPRHRHHHHRDAAETGTGRVAVETTTTSARGKGEQGDDYGVASTSRSDRRPAAAVLLLRRRSWLARRFLLEGVVEGADSAAKPSCRSSDVHIGCTPASEH